MNIIPQIDLKEIKNIMNPRVSETNIDYKTAFEQHYYANWILEQDIIDLEKTIVTLKEQNLEFQRQIDAYNEYFFEQAKYIEKLEVENDNYKRKASA